MKTIKYILAIAAIACCAACNKNDNNDTERLCNSLPEYTGTMTIKIDGSEYITENSRMYYKVSAAPLRDIYEEMPDVDDETEYLAHLVTGTDYLYNSLIIAKREYSGSTIDKFKEIAYNEGCAPDAGTYFQLNVDTFDKPVWCRIAPDGKVTSTDGIKQIIEMKGFEFLEKSFYDEHIKNTTIRHHTVGDPIYRGPLDCYCKVELTNGQIIEFSMVTFERNEYPFCYDHDYACCMQADFVRAGIETTACKYVLRREKK